MKKKKIKNPELYIRRLKRQVAGNDKRYEWLRQRWLALIGNIVVNWKRHDQSFTTSGCYIDLLPGEEVAIIGRVKEVKNEIDFSCKNKSGEMIVEVTQLRKVSGFLPDPEGSKK